jgi:hypothetical protein
MTSFTTPRLTIILAVIMGSLAVTCSALAATRPDDRAGVRGTGGQAAPAQVVVGGPGLSARPDNRAGILGVGSDASDTAFSVATSTGFNWTDAGVGAAAAAGVLVLLGSAALLAMPKRQHRRATA